MKNNSVFKSDLHTGRHAETHTETKKEIWLEWEQQMHHFRTNKGRGWICLREHT